MEERLRSIWSKQLDKLPVYKDLPRLAGRISIESTKPMSAKRISRRVSTLRFSRDGMNEEEDKLEVVPDQQSTDPTTEKIWRQIKKAILGVAVNVEDEERYLFISRGLQDFGTYAGELELEMKRLFENVLGDDSKTTRVFKVIHQNALFAGCLELKTKVPMQTLTKDVRGPDGWKILISFSKDTICIDHVKREEALATAPETEKFWFEWKMHMTFDKDMNDLQASLLKVSNLGFGDHISEAKKAEITKILCAGNMFIS